MFTEFCENTFKKKNLYKKFYSLVNLYQTYYTYFILLLFK